MNWTTEKPTLDGYYWWRNQERSASVVVMIRDGEQFWIGCEGSDFLIVMGGQWCGPLIEPK